MRKMAEAFNTTVSALEEELMQLILDGKISARIDSHNKARNLMNTFFCIAMIKMQYEISNNIRQLN